MGAALATWETRVRQLLGNTTTQAAAILPTPDLDGHVYAAVRQFSIDSPRETYSDFTGNGSGYQFAVPAGWVNGFSRVTKVEYPQGSRPPLFLDMAEIQEYPQISAPTYIQFN